MTARQRAEPLAPEDRRKAIVDAVTPLLLEKGGNITTAEIARAAAVAEGTIFRVFSDKTELLHETIKSCFDPGTALDQLAAIERDLPFEIKLREAAAIILQRSERVHALIAALRSMPPPDHSRLHDTRDAAIEAGSRILGGLTRLFADDSHRLVVEPARAAAAFRGLLYAVSFPLSDPDELISADDAIGILLDGVLARETM